MPSHSQPHRAIPNGLRWIALLWLLFWVPVYWRTWGPANFLHFCDIAVILTCIGLWTNDALLLSSQAVSSVVIDIVWTLDVSARLLFGRHVIGATEYLFDPAFPLWTRLISLFHIVMPLVLLWSLSRVGYDRRGWKLQSAIALPVLIASRLVTPNQNLNFAVADPIFHRAFGPAPIHIGIMFLILVFVIYFPTHFVFMRLFRRPGADARREK
jgi:hypothetical protein